MANRAQNIQIKPHDAYFEAKETYCFDLKGFTAATADGMYLSFKDAAGADHYFWFDVDNLSVDPAPGGTGYEVDVTAGDVDSALVAALQAAIVANLAASYNSSVSGTQITMEYVDFSTIGDPSTDLVGLEIDTVVKGSQIYLGLLDGDITVTPEQTFFDVTSHQTGQTILSKIPQNLGASVELTIKECTKAIYKELITASGGTYTPGGGTELYGWGTDKLSTNIFPFAKRLRLTPVGAVDSSKDWVFWKTFPELGGITFSGENPQLLPVTFSAFPDDTKPTPINVYAIGDHTQVSV